MRNQTAFVDTPGNIEWAQNFKICVLYHFEAPRLEFKETRENPAEYSDAIIEIKDVYLHTESGDEVEIKPTADQLEDLEKYIFEKHH